MSDVLLFFSYSFSRGICIHFFFWRVVSKPNASSYILFPAPHFSVWFMCPFIFWLVALHLSLWYITTTTNICGLVAAVTSIDSGRCVRCLGISTSRRERWLGPGSDRISICCCASFCSSWKLNLWWWMILFNMLNSLVSRALSLISARWPRDLVYPFQVRRPCKPVSQLTAVAMCGFYTYSTM